MCSWHGIGVDPEYYHVDNEHVRYLLRDGIEAAQPWLERRADPIGNEIHVQAYHLVHSDDRYSING